MAAEPFQSMYLQMCPQALVEVRGILLYFNFRIKNAFYQLKYSARKEGLISSFPRKVESIQVNFTE